MTREGDVSAQAEVAEDDAARVLHADARFTRLPPPDYDIDARGIRPGTAPALSLVGGLLVLSSPFGAWLRVTRLAAEDGRAEVVQEVLGRDLGGGTLLVVLAVLATSTTALWPRRSRWARRTAHLAVLATVAGVATMTVQLQGRIGETARAAIEQAGFHDLTPGAGWGAWAGIVGAAALLLASVYAGLAGTADGTEGR